MPRVRRDWILAAVVAGVGIVSMILLWHGGPPRESTFTFLYSAFAIPTSAGFMPVSETMRKLVIVAMALFVLFVTYFRPELPISDGTAMGLNLLILMLVMGSALFSLYRRDRAARLATP